MAGQAGFTTVDSRDGLWTSRAQLAAAALLGVPLLPLEPDPEPEPDEDDEDEASDFPLEPADDPDDEDPDDDDPDDDDPDDDDSDEELAGAAAVLVFASERLSLR